MPPEGSKETADGWVRLATRDHQAAVALASSDDLAATAIYHCQQAVEKSLKAVLISRGIVPPFVHAIETLVAALPESIVPPAVLTDAADLLMGAYLEMRYDPWATAPLEGDVPAALDAAADAVAWARQVVDA